MSGCTGIEIGPDFCVLAKGRVRESAREPRAARLLEGVEWPSDEEGQIALLRGARRDLRLPRPARVVVWPARERPRFSHRQPEESEHRDQIAALRAAGFQIRAILSPAEALTQLARFVPRPVGEGAVAWLAINRHGAAVAIVRSGLLLHARVFNWTITAPEQRRQAHLLRRYILVAQILPQLRQAFEAVRVQHSVSVESAIACGNLPDLRSLTMPLTEGLDVEFETLDSPDGSTAAGGPDGAALESPAAWRLAWAAAAGAGAEGSSGLTRWIDWRWAAVLFLAIGVSWWGARYWFGQTPASSTEARPAPTPSAGQEAKPRIPDTLDRGTEPAPAPAAGQHVEGPRDVQSRPQPTTGIMGERERAPSGDAAAPPAVPLPAVRGILIAPERRLAIVDDSVVGVGDPVGSWVVVRIEPDAVLLRGPAGQEVRVPVTRRRPAVSEGTAGPTVGTGWSNQP
ncbi:MAG TPA: hypothetical protein VLD67_20975 [Vicinamibacterales bacterium]|nr:hypothetical protein [Vicinamibacterales bacterium]